MSSCSSLEISTDKNYLHLSRMSCDSKNFGVETDDFDEECTAERSTVEQVLETRKANIKIKEGVSDFVLVKLVTKASKNLDFRRERRERSA